MSEREQPHLRGVEDRLIVDVAKPSHAADKIFCLLVPTEAPIVVHWILGVFGSSEH